VRARARARVFSVKWKEEKSRNSILWNLVCGG